MKTNIKALKNKVIQFKLIVDRIDLYIQHLELSYRLNQNGMFDCLDQAENLRKIRNYEQLRKYTERFGRLQAENKSIIDVIGKLKQIQPRLDSFYERMNFLYELLSSNDLHQFHSDQCDKKNLFGKFIARVLRFFNYVDVPEVELCAVLINEVKTEAPRAQRFIKATEKFIKTDDIRNVALKNKTLKILNQVIV